MTNVSPPVIGVPDTGRGGIAGLIRHRPVVLLVAVAAGFLVGRVVKWGAAGVGARVRPALAARANRRHGRGA